MDNFLKSLIPSIVSVLAVAITVGVTYQFFDVLLADRVISGREDLTSILVVLVPSFLAIGISSAYFVRSRMKEKD